jgi:hypothetical protein
MVLLSVAPCRALQKIRVKTHGLMGQLGEFSPGLKPGHCKIKRSRGFENPLPRTEVRGWHNSEFFRGL